MGQRIAVINAGSSSIKFALFEGGAGSAVLFRGQVENLGVAPKLTVKDAGGEGILERSWPASELDHASATKVILDTALDLLGGEPVRGVGHRVVHGGTEFTAPVRITADVTASLRKLCPLAPLHQPHNLAPIEAIAEAAPHVPQVACFDTAFHSSQPQLAHMLAVPRKLTDEGVRRYGFHGLSYEYVSLSLREIAPELARGRTIIAHLGNGASLCALKDGKSVATTMGFTAVDGLVMGTRCGSIDPGVLIYLMDEHGLDARGIENLVYRQSGLLGVSGLSSDMRTLRGSADPHAQQAVDLFVYRIVREIGSLAAALGGIDGLVFTGGIGENDAATRQQVVEGCGWLGARLDGARDGGAQRRISASDSGVDVWVVPTNEEQMIATHTAALLDP
jgi:acetate kinase